MFADFPQRTLNKCVDTGKCPSCLKQADITPVFKKASRNSKDNYRPVSILTNVSKIFEKLLFKQMSNDFFDKFFSMYQRNFRKRFGDQHCLVLMLKQFKSFNDKQKSFGALMADLSKAFSCLSHELIITRLHAYEFDEQALELMNSYLSERNQRTKLGVHYSS